MSEYGWRPGTRALYERTMRERNRIVHGQLRGVEPSRQDRRRLRRLHRTLDAIEGARLAVGFARMERLYST